MTVVRTGALGMIETRGLLGAIEAADAALKSASVSLIGARKAGGGLITVLLSGDVAAVRSALDAASASLSKLGIRFSAHVIPRLDPEAWSLTEDVGLTDAAGLALPQEPGDAAGAPFREDAARPESFLNGKGEVDGPNGGSLGGTATAVPLAVSLRDGLRRMTVARGLPRHPDAAPDTGCEQEGAGRQAGHVLRAVWGGEPGVGLGEGRKTFAKKRGDEA